MNAFLMTDLHIRLLQRMLVSWNPTQLDNENGGAPGISITRPYGNSDSLGDLAEEANVPTPDWEVDKDYDSKVKAFLLYLHRDMQNALQYALYTRRFEPGIYISQYGHYDISEIAQLDILDSFTITRIDETTLRLGVKHGAFIAFDRVREPLPRVPFLDDKEDNGFGHVYDIALEGVGPLCSTVDTAEGVIMGVAIQQFLMKELWGYSIYEQSKLGQKKFEVGYSEDDD